MEKNSNYPKELSYISKFAGQSEKMVQAGGGNTSVKTDDKLMLIKSSGYQLAEITESSGYSVVNYKEIADLFLKNNPDNSLESKILMDTLVKGPKPSIETFLHAITRKYTIHVHPLGVTVMVSHNDGVASLKSMFPGCAVIDYATPGIKLAKELFSCIKEKDVPEIIFLKNHGLIVNADSFEATVRLLSDTVSKIDDFLGIPVKERIIAEELFMKINSYDNNLIVYHCDSSEINEAVKQSGGVWPHRFSPDCVVYCGSEFLVSAYDNIDEALQKYYKSYGIPKIAVIDGAIFIIAPNVKKAHETESVLKFTANVYMMQKYNAFDIISDDEAAFLLNWESEKYRSRMNG